MSSESSTTGAMTASSTSASGGWSLRMSISSRTCIGTVSFAGWSGRSQLAQPVLRPLEQEEADVLAPVEVVGDALVVVEVHVGEIDARAGDHRQRPLGRVGHARERVDRGD